MDYGLGSSQSGMRQPRKTGFGEIEVQWGRERLRVPLPPPASPLSTLKDTLYNMTGVAPAYQKLIHSGAVMKDDLTSLASYGLVDLTPPSDENAAASSSFWDSWSFGGGGKKQKVVKIVMLGSKETEARVTEDRFAARRIPVEEPVVEKEPEIESNVVKEIQELSGEKLDALEPQIKAIEDWLATPILTSINEVSTPTPEIATAKSVETKTDVDAADPSEAPLPALPALLPPNPRTPIFLSEVLIQSLLKLDSYQISSDWTEARKARKEAVRKVQLLLDRVDTLKESMKARL